MSATCRALDHNTTDGNDLGVALVVTVDAMTPQTGYCLGAKNEMLQH
jgi:hypothetical protein